VHVHSRARAHTHTHTQVPASACTFTADKRLEQTFSSLYEALPVVCSAEGISEKAAVKQFMCYFLHLILGAVPGEVSPDGVSQTAVEMFTAMTANSTG
jgi:hypothetical protein